MDVHDAAHRRQMTIPVVLAQLFFVGAFFLYFRVISIYTIMISLLLIMAASLLSGKRHGFFSGLFIAIAQLISLFFDAYPGLPIVPIQYSWFIDNPSLLSLIMLPVFGWLSGFYAETFGIKSRKLEKQIHDLSEANRILSGCIHRYDDEFQQLSQVKVYRHSWDSWIDENETNEQIIGALLASLSDHGLPQTNKNHAVKITTRWDHHSTAKLFDLLIHTRPEVLAVMKLDGKIVLYNDVLMALYGYSPTQRLENTCILDLLLPVDAEKATVNIAKAVKSELQQNEQYCMKTMDSHFAKLLISPSITIECIGNPLMLIASIGNLSLNTVDYDQSRDASGLKDLVDLARKNIMCLSHQHQITFVSPAVAEMQNTTSEDMLGKKIGRFISQKHLYRLDDFLRTCQEGKQCVLEIEMMPHMRKRTIFLLNAYPSIGATGRFLGTILLIDNITSVKLIEEALEHRLSMEKMISSISTRFISIKADELDNEILSVIKNIGDFEEAEESYVEIYQSKRIKNRAKFNMINANVSGKNHLESGSGQLSYLANYETISIPIVIESESMGFFRFYQEQYRNNWFETDLELIRLIGEIIINALIRKENELSIRLNENRLSTTLHSIGDAVIATDLSGHIILMNGTAENLTGWIKDEAINLPLDRVFNPYQGMTETNEDSPEIDALHHLSETDDSMILESKDGNRHYISVNRKQIEDQSSGIYGDVIVFRDVTREKHENDEIRYISYHDKLTGLFNRAFFEEELVRLNTKRQYPITLIIGDCNGLKIANDIFGHLEGDKLLQTIAGILRKATRHEDIVARWGGDEFVIILSKTDELAGAIVRERILQLCNEAESYPIQPSLALGSATNTEIANASDDLMGLLKLAEDRMYRHKLMEGKSARNTILLSIEKMIYEKSYETEEHASRLAEISRKLGQAIGLSDYEIEELSLLSVLHDMGKIGIPDNILLKPEQLNEIEWEIMKKHSEKGYNLAKSTPELTSIADSILHHHERWDGSGYPSGLRGEEIPKLSRILSIIDAYDVITHSRSYKLAQSKLDALNEIAQCSGSQFDPELSEIFIKIMKE